MTLKYRLLATLLCVVCGSLSAQTTKTDKTWVLTTNESAESKNYVAKESIKLQATGNTGFSFSSAGGKTFSAKIDTRLVFAPTPTLYVFSDGTSATTSTKVINGKTETGTQTVGTIPGQFAVGSTGGATYTIPIEIPTGINGMQPHITIGYNSQGGNGIVGMGWSVQGVSSISRIGANLYNDGYNDIPKLSTKDNLILDGQRLILVSGSNLTDGAKYRTEIESYSDITYKSINGYECFEVKTKGGVIMEFGSSADSYAHALGSTEAITWLLNKVSDPNGNFMTYNYENDSEYEEYWLASIKYTCNLTAGITTGANEIIFNYSTNRADSQTGYIGGEKQKQTRLLLSIVTKSNTEIQREYSFEYSYTDGFYNKLTTVNLKGNDGFKYTPTVINWDKRNSTVTPSFTTTTNVVGSSFTGSLDNTMLFIDLNNDGFSDLIRPVLDPLLYNYCGWEIYYSSNNGQNFTLAQKEDLNNSTFFPFTGEYQMHPVDVNQDGACDIVEIRTQSISGSKKYNMDILLNVNGQLVRQNKNKYFYCSTTQNYTFNFGDYSGNGNVEMLTKKGTVLDLFQLEFSTGSFYLTNVGTTVLSAESDPTETTDINGNGKSEVFIPSSSKFLEYEPISMKFVELPFVTNFNTVQYKIEFTDINGDGKTDVLLYNFISKTWSCQLSTGIDFVNFTCPLTRQRVPKTLGSDEFNDNYFFGDYNGDGKPDIMEVYPDGNINKLNIYYFNGGNFIKGQYPDILLKNFYSNRLVPYYDINGDGKSDLIGINSSNTSLSTMSFNTSETEQRVTSITNGMNQATSFSYKPLSDNTVYFKASHSHVNPVVDICAPIYVVSQSTSSVGAISDTINYTYTGLKFHTKGKGLLGFCETMQDNITQNRKSITEYGYGSIYFNTFPLSQKITTSSGLPISTTTYDNGYALKSGKRIFPISAQTTTDHLTGLVQIIGRISYDLYDSYGNLTYQTIINGSVTERKSITYTNAGSWCPNKISQITTVKTLNNQTYTRTTDYTYDSKGNLTTEVTDPTDANSLTTTYSAYDDFGHCRLITSTANGVSRTTSSVYVPSGRFLKSKTSVLGETTNYLWDENKGLLSSENNRLGTTEYTYNGFGNIIETKYPDGIRKVQVLLWASPNNAIGAKYYAYSETSGNSPVVIWYDAMGRELQKDVYGLNAKKISVTTEYYLDSKVYRVSEPYFEADAASKTWAKTYIYDTFGRPTSLTTPMGVCTTTYNGRINIANTSDGVTESTINDVGQTVTSKVNGKSVSYTYYPSGLIKTTTPEGGQAITMEYDLQGKRTKLTDPDAGTIETKYNGFGELLEEKQLVHNATDYIITTNNYGTNGLLQSILRNTETTTYIYDSKNRINSIEITGKNKQTFTYDDFDRIINVNEIIGTKGFNSATEYDLFGRVNKEIYPSGYYVLNNYDDYGNLTEVKDKSGRSVWKVIDENARGQLTNISKGGKVTTFGFDARGFNTSILANGVQNMAYVFNSKGNLDSRTDYLTNQKEQFVYDGMNRLTNWDVYQNNVLTKQNSITFDATTGNISTKSDLGNYAMNYGQNGRPHALTSIMGVPSSISPYDLNVTYTDFKKIETLSEGDGINAGSKFYRVSYGVDDQRRKSEYYQYGQAQGLTLTRYYLGNFEEEVNATTGKTKKIHYLSAAILVQETGQPDKFYYTYSDFQGSLIALTDENGSVVESYAYDPWGARRNPADWTQKDNRTTWIVNRGYTGHEHIDAFGIINMNGRVYDPATAMFMSPDPQLQSPGDWLNYNRYGYCMNNPFKYTDPSGEFWHILIGAVVGGVINWVSNGCQFNMQGLAYFGAGAAAGALTAAMPGSAIAISGGLGAANSVIGQGFKDGKFDIKNVDFMSTMSAGMMSMVTSYAGGQLTGALHLDKVLGGISSPLLQKGLEGTIGGSVVGTVFGGLSAVANGQNVGQGLWSGAKMGFVSGSISGIGSAGQFALDNKVNLFTGKPNPVMERPVTPEVLPTPLKGSDIDNKVVDKFQEHAFSNDRHNDLNLRNDVITQKTMDIVIENRAQLNQGQNILQGTINGMPKSITVNVNEGIIRSINLYPGYTNRISVNPIINYGNLKWK